MSRQDAAVALMAMRSVDWGSEKCLVEERFLTSAGRPVHPVKACGMEKSAQERSGKKKSACSVRNDEQERE